MSLRLMSALISTSVLDNHNGQQNSDSLIKQLLECVQQCQKRFGGKSQLASDLDSCILSLCFTLESVLLHGLKSQQKPTTIKQVVNHLKSEDNGASSSSHPSFWPFLCKHHLTKHEVERYNNLKQIWTDIGRCRAWLRSSLNERSLERYLLNFTKEENFEILSQYYEDWALICDVEKSNLLPQMAAGLTSILFAINIDKAELNAFGIPKRFAHQLKITQTNEPIIEAPHQKEFDDENKKITKRKKNRKVARQFISFDEDSEISITTREEINKSIKMEQKDNNNKLTPLNQSEIGELIPVSVEISEKHCSHDENNVERPSDVSSILTIVEQRNEKELTKKQEQIDELLKENQCLKEQVANYLSAIKMLGKNQEEEGAEGNSAAKKEDESTDYKIEAEQYESKLVQVAEMHAELMDFNIRLQQTITQKDLQLKEMKKQLERLSDGKEEELSYNDNNKCGVEIWIPSAFLTGSSNSKSYHVYQIYIRAGQDEWNIFRRYREFYALHCDLKKLDPKISTFDFPPKKSIGKKDSGLVEERRKRLQRYLRKVLAHWPELLHCSSRFMLEQHLAFFKEDKIKLFSSNSTSSSSSNSNDNHYTGL